jgi:hypothetical protein
MRCRAEQHYLHGSLATDAANGDFPSCGDGVGFRGRNDHNRPLAGKVIRANYITSARPRSVWRNCFGAHDDKDITIGEMRSACVGEIDPARKCGQVSPTEVAKRRFPACLGHILGHLRRLAKMRRSPSQPGQNVSQLRAWVSMPQAGNGEFVARTGGAHLRAQDGRRRSTRDRDLCTWAQ